MSAIAKGGGMPVDLVRIPARTQPVCRHLEEALALGETGPAGPLGRALKAVCHRRSF